MRRLILTCLATTLFATACSSGPTYTPWGESVAAEDILTGEGYTSELRLGSADVRFIATPDETVLWSREDDITLVQVDSAAGSFGFRRLGDGPWTTSDAAAPTWPTALLVPSFADVLVAASAASAEGEEEDGSVKFVDGPLDLSQVSLGPDLYLTYWLDPDGRVRRWATGSDPDAPTIEWNIRPAATSDLDGLPTLDEVVDAAEVTGLIGATAFTGTSIAGESAFVVEFITETDDGTAAAALRVAGSTASIDVSGTDSPRVAFAFRDDEVAAFNDGSWTLDGADELEAFGDTLFVLSPDVTYTAITDALIDADAPTPETIDGRQLLRYDVANVPATVATQQFGWPDADVQIWVTGDGVPIQWQARTTAGLATWRISQLGGDVEPFLPPEWTG